MILHHEDLIEAMGKPDLTERLVIMPLMDLDQVGEASIDLRLGPEFRLLNRTEDSALDPAAQPQGVAERMHRRVQVEVGDKLWLHPGQFVLGATLEFMRIPADLAAYVIGRSSWGRVGLIPATAIYVQPGFSGCLTLELVNHGESPIALYPGLCIAQLVVHRLSGTTRHVYGSGAEERYVGATGPRISRLADEHDQIEHLKKIQARVAGKS
jgi:dCTP deaminase